MNALDLFDLRSSLSEDEQLVQDSVARLVDTRVLPLIQACFEKHRFPRELVPELAALGLLGASLEGYGCAGLNAICSGLICQELERGDSALRSFVSVQSSLVMYPIWAYGSELQKQQYLPRMARGELIGCFGLTEPHGGSDPANMKTRARRSGGDWLHQRLQDVDHQRCDRRHLCVLGGYRRRRARLHRRQGHARLHSHRDRAQVLAARLQYRCAVLRRGARAGVARACRAPPGSRDRCRA